LVKYTFPKVKKKMKRVVPSERDEVEKSKFAFKSVGNIVTNENTPASDTK
jgi:hypothetical protein